LESYGAHHLFMAARGKFVVDPIRHFPCKDLVELPRLWVTDELAKPVGVSRSMLLRLYMYGRSLKQAEDRDMVAKIRQATSTEELL